MSFVAGMLVYAQLLHAVPVPLVSAGRWSKVMVLAKAFRSSYAAQEFCEVASICST
jgi:hypothetical protein